MLVAAPVMADITLSWSDLALGVGPLAAAAGAWWVISRADAIVAHCFPDAQWERSLGWLNLSAERRADRAMRWLGYALYVLLFDALVIMIWSANGLATLLATWDDPYVFGTLLLHLGALMLCTLIWVLYLGCGLLPSIRDRREIASLRADRRRIDEEERERAAHEPAPTSRVYGGLPKPRKSTLPATPSDISNRLRRHGPGG
jgi:hypothetical protein